MTNSSRYHTTVYGLTVKPQPLELKEVGLQMALKLHGYNERNDTEFLASLLGAAVGLTLWILLAFAMV